MNASRRVETTGTAASRVRKARPLKRLSPGIQMQKILRVFHIYSPHYPLWKGCNREGLEWTESMFVREISTASVSLILSHWPEYRRPPINWPSRESYRTAQSEDPATRMHCEIHWIEVSSCVTESAMFVLRLLTSKGSLLSSSTQLKQLIKLKVCFFGAMQSPSVINQHNIDIRLSIFFFS